jgi:hypothetical protein
MQALRREELKAEPKVLRVTVESLTALFKAKRLGTLVPATLVVNDAGEQIVRQTQGLPAALQC